MFLIELYKPIEPQYIDVENLLTARFGKDNATVNEIMEYIKSKDTRKKDLPDRKWIINNQTVLVGSDQLGHFIMVWRAKMKNIAFILIITLLLLSSLSVLADKNR